MGRNQWIGVGIGIVAVIVVGVALAFRTTTTPASIEFDGVAGTEPGDPGVYSYLTDGYEEVDALGGGRHDYPATTAMTVSDTTCGTTVRWQPLEERWTEWDHCDPDLGVTATREYHEWFGIPDVETEECETPRPIDAAAAEVVCVAVETVETYRIEVVGREVVTIGGEQVDAVHVRRTSVLSGASVGTAVVDEWRLPDTVLLLRVESVTENTTSSPIGDVTYREEVVLTLENLTPGG